METVKAEEQDRRFDGGVFIHYGTDNSSINVLVLPAFPRSGNNSCDSMVYCNSRGA